MTEMRTGVVIPGPCRTCGSAGTVSDGEGRPRQPCGFCAARTALAFLLTRIGSWTNATWKQHVQHEYGDAVAGLLVGMLQEWNVPLQAYASTPTKLDGNCQVRARHGAYEGFMCCGKEGHAGPHTITGGLNGFPGHTVVYEWGGPYDG